MANYKHYCSREDSRQARDIINQRVYPFLRGDPVHILPPDCPLHPALDIFRTQESHSSLVPGKLDVYECGLCGKRFRTQFYMDRHMDNKHADQLDTSGDSWRCLGNLCDTLGCGKYASGGETCPTGGKTLIAGSGAASGGMACTKCDASEMDRRKFNCKALFQRCFNTWNGGSYGGLSPQEVGNLRDHFLHQFCDHLGCDANNWPLPPPATTKGAAYPLNKGYGRVYDPHALKMGSAKGALVILLALVVAIIYAVMGLVLRARSTHEDLRPARRTDAGGRIGESFGSASGILNRSAHLRRRITALP